MQQPKVICTIATKPALADLKLWLHSLVLWNGTDLRNGKLHIYVMGDDVVLEQLPKTSWMIGCPGLQKYATMNRNTMSAKSADWPILAGRSLWDQFQLEKATVMRKVLADGHENVLFTDCDLVFLSPLCKLQTEYEVILSPHYIKKSDTDKFGYFNGGWMWTRTPASLSTWLAATLTSRFHEQAALEDVARIHKTGIMPPTENYGWWRLFQADIAPIEQVKKFSIINGIICFDGQPVTSIHTHFVGSNESDTSHFNEFILKCTTLANPMIQALGEYIRKMQNSTV